MSSENFIKGQGAQRNEINRFEKYTFEPEEDDFLKTKTTFTEVFPKTIVNEVKSPDIRMEYSLNPYQGCEHGCSYCFARPTHEFWGYSAGTDFERKIMVKKNAPELLEKLFQKLVATKLRTSNTLKSLSEILIWMFPSIPKRIILKHFQRF